MADVTDRRAEKGEERAREELHCTALYCIVLQCIVLQWIALQCAALNCIALHYIDRAHLGPYVAHESRKEGMG